jgi:antitoxin VapB
MMYIAFSMMYIAGMALHITDPAAEAAVRRLAQVRKVTLTQAVAQSATEALSREKEKASLLQRIKPIQDRVAAWNDQPGPIETEKEFMDAMWSDD